MAAEACGGATWYHTGHSFTRPVGRSAAMKDEDGNERQAHPDEWHIVDVLAFMLIGGGLFGGSHLPWWVLVGVGFCTLVVNTICRATHEARAANAREREAHQRYQRILYTLVHRH